MTAPHIPGRLRVDECGQHKRILLRCDDRAGFMLSVLWAADGDLHLSIEADPDHEDYKVNCLYISGSVRLRLPMIGGGMYEHLQPALAVALQREIAVERGQQVFTKTKKCKHVRWVPAHKGDSPSAKCADCGKDDGQWYCPESISGLCDYSKHGPDQCTYCGQPDERK